MKPLQGDVHPDAVAVDPDVNLEWVIESIAGDLVKHLVVVQDS